MFKPNEEEQSEYHFQDIEYKGYSHERGNLDRRKTLSSIDKASHYSSDESFKAMEHLCNSTATDANSILFNNLQINDIKKKMEFADGKNFSDDFNYYLVLRTKDAKDIDKVQTPISDKRILSELKMANKKSLSFNQIERNIKIRTDTKNRSVSIPKNIHYCDELDDLELNNKNQFVNHKKILQKENLEKLNSSETHLKFITDKGLADDKLDFVYKQFKGNENIENRSSNSLQCFEELPDSPAFDNTLEEVEYKMTKGIEVMKSHNDQARIMLDALPEDEINKINAMFLTPNKEKKFIFAPEIDIHQLLKSPSIALKKSSSIKDSCKKQISMSSNKKIMTKFNGLKSSLQSFTSNTKSSLKSQVIHASSMGKHINKTDKSYFIEQNKRRFPHINSLVGAYIKTGNLPYTTQNKSQIKSNTFETNKMKSYIGDINTTARSLPIKAYISSEIEHIPMSVTGGNKDQQYIHTALIPAAVCHDGKLKTSEVDPEQKVSKMCGPTTEKIFSTDFFVKSNDILGNIIDNVQQL